jgi:hypothetical protein
LIPSEGIEYTIDLVPGAKAEQLLEKLLKHSTGNNKIMWQREHKKDATKSVDNSRDYNDCLNTEEHKPQREETEEEGEKLSPIEHLIKGLKEDLVRRESENAVRDSIITSNEPDGSSNTDFFGE